MALNRSPATTSQLLVINVKTYEGEKDREVSRYRLSHETLLRISGRKRNLREKFLSDLRDELAERDWVFFRSGTEYAMVSVAKLDSWVKLSSKRVAPLFDEDPEIIEARFQELAPDDEGHEEDGA